MIIKPIDAESVQSFKAVRLAALRDTPLAFGSTFAEESQLSDADWARRVARRNGDRSIGFLAWDGDQPAGLAASYFDQDDPGKAYLVSMWVAPSHRRHGVGQLLVEGVINWACDQHARTLSLMVTSNNDRAIRLYERLGFRKTGYTEPYPNDAALVEFEMIRTLITPAE